MNSPLTGDMNVACRGVPRPAARACGHGRRAGGGALRQIESELAEMDDEDEIASLADLGLQEPGLNRVAVVKDGDVLNFLFNV